MQLSNGGCCRWDEAPVAARARQPMQRLLSASALSPREEGLQMSKHITRIAIAVALGISVGAAAAAPPTVYNVAASPESWVLAP
jgi:hypothetical protein